MELYTDMKLSGMIKKNIIELQVVRVLYLCTIPNRFCESPKLKHWICEVCMILQVQSHMSLY